MIVQILVNSILAGLLLSLVAVGFNLIFNSTNVFHLAHGALYVGAVYAVYGLNSYFGQVLPQGFSVPLSIGLSTLLICALVIIVEYLIYRPLYRKDANSSISLISSLGVYLLVVNILVFFNGNESISLGKNHSIVVANEYFKLTDIELLNLAISLVLIAAILYFIRTKLYVRIRAISNSYSVAEKFGIDIQRTRILALLVGTVLVGIAGIMRGYEVSIDPYVGLTITLAASVAVIIGGVKSIPGTIVACLMISFIENVSVLFLSAQWKDALTYVLLIAVLIFYQQGLISNKHRIEVQ